MIGYLTGLIIDKDEKQVVVLTQGLGYNVSVTSEVLSRVRKDEKIQLHIHTAVREDDIALYGFTAKEELHFFKQLIGVSGIGPKMAMDILACPLRITQKAILNEDIAVLTNIKGIGKKTAERIVLELKNKIVPLELGALEKSPASNEEAVMALVGLGYERVHVIKALAEMPGEVRETEAIVKHFLKHGS